MGVDLVTEFGDIDGEVVENGNKTHILSILQGKVIKLRSTCSRFVYFHPDLCTHKLNKLSRVELSEGKKIKLFRFE